MEATMNRSTRDTEAEKALSGQPAEVERPITFSDDELKKLAADGRELRRSVERSLRAATAVRAELWKHRVR